MTATDRALRLIHTADWHLGQALHGIDRGPEHDRFLRFLTETLAETGADALIVAGDVFDSASPSAAAQQRYYRFLADLRRDLPDLQVVILGGNHDSPARLDAPSELLANLGVRVVGGLRRDGDGEIDLAAHVIPLKRTRDPREPPVMLLALPFLRPRDVSMLTGPDGPPEDGPGESAAIERFVAGYRELVRRLGVRARTLGAARVVATGHCFMQGGAVSEDSERRIQMGNQAALPVDLYLDPELDLAYVALGHLHRAQSVEVEHVRYSGSPIPLSLAERGYDHQVLIVDVPETGPAAVRSRPVPRSVAFELVPPDGPGPLPQVEAALRSRARPADPGPAEAWPILEVQIQLDGPEPKLRDRIQAALAGAPARLARISIRRPQVAPAPAVGRRLEELSVEEVFRQAYLRERGRPPGPELMEVFGELLHEVESASRSEETEP